MHLKVKCNGVNGDQRATGKVLQGSCEEGLGEEEPTDPEYSWNAI